MKLILFAIFLVLLTNTLNLGFIHYGLLFIGLIIAVIGLFNE